MSDETILRHEFIKPIKYTPKNSGEEIEAQFIQLNEPSVQHLSACSVLKQAFMRAIAKEADGADDTEEKPDDKIAMEDLIIRALYASDVVDINTVFLSAKELFKEVGLVDGEKKPTVPMLNAMSIPDIEKMTGKYMANFILASVLREQ